MENWSEFDKLVRVIQHACGLQGLQVKISKISQQRKKILIIFCISESVASIILIREAFETDAQLNKEVK